MYSILCYAADKASIHTSAHNNINLLNILILHPIRSLHFKPSYLLQESYFFEVFIFEIPETSRKTCSFKALATSTKQWFIL